MNTEVSLSERQAHEILGLAGLGGVVSVTLVKQHNHVYRIQCREDVFFLKTYTKAWYGDDVARTGGCVEHEHFAWSTLAAHGLAVPEVVLAMSSCENPLGRPFILTRKLRGVPLTDLLHDRAQIPELLLAVGDYLGRMHAITFAFPGYLMPGGLETPPDEQHWQHRCWTARARQQEALAMLRAERADLSSELVQRLEACFAEIEQVLAPAYQPPRFVHGDCHAHQFFLYQDAGRWHVSGVVDLEVASAGDSGEDLLKLTIELTHRLPATRWWEPLFAGYGQSPEFERLKLRLLGAGAAEFAGHRWFSTREQTLAHLLDASSWQEL